MNPAKTCRDERGSISLWLATTGFTMIVLVGLAIDLGGQVHTQQRAHAVAAEAARVAGQQLQPAPAIRGDDTTANPTQAVRAARTYLTASGLTGTVAISGGTAITVDTTDVYATKFLGIIGITSMTVTGHAQARITRSVEGVEQ